MPRAAPRRGCAVFLAAALQGAPVQAQSRAEIAWRELTPADVEAAHDLVSRNHPGAVAATGDTAFQRLLADGLRQARARASQVSSYEGWLATLRAFAVGLGDPHIALKPRVALATVRWPGFVAGWQGDALIVRSRDTTHAADLPALGARVVACDGVPAEELARARLGTFRGDWAVAAQRVRTAPVLLVDDGNPFLPRLARCVVREGDAERTVELRWRSIPPTALQERLREAAPVGRAGFGVRRVDAGWWIGLESMNPRAQLVLDSVSAHLGEIRDAPWVVVDLRGNGGGSSEWGRRLTVLLAGESRTNAAIRRLERNLGDGRCGGSWRASADVEETLEGYIRDLGPRLGQATIENWRRELAAVRAARTAGRELAPEPRACPARDRAEPGSLPAAAMAGRLVLLTDHACFSSCLFMPPLFQALGALHVGEGTDYSTRYMEVRGFPLPSGLGSFSTLQRVSFEAPERLGPFEPALPFPGRVDDTEALERWVVRVLRGS